MGLYRKMGQIDSHEAAYQILKINLRRHEHHTQLPHSEPCHILFVLRALFLFLAKIDFFSCSVF